MLLFHDRGGARSAPIRVAIKDRRRGLGGTAHERHDGQTRFLETPTPSGETIRIVGEDRDHLDGKARDVECRDRAVGCLDLQHARRPDEAPRGAGAHAQPGAMHPAGRLLLDGKPVGAEQPEPRELRGRGEGARCVSGWCHHRELELGHLPHADARRLEHERCARRRGNGVARVGRLPLAARQAAQERAQQQRLARPHDPRAPHAAALRAARSRKKRPRAWRGLRSVRSQSSSAPQRRSSPSRRCRRARVAAR